MPLTLSKYCGADFEETILKSMRLRARCLLRCVHLSEQGVKYLPTDILREHVLLSTPSLDLDLLLMFTVQTHQFLSHLEAGKHVVYSGLLDSILAQLFLLRGFVTPSMH